MLPAWTLISISLAPQVLIETDTSRTGKSFREKSASASLTLPGARGPGNSCRLGRFKAFYAVLSIFLPSAGHVTMPGSWKPRSLSSVSSVGDTPWEQLGGAVGQEPSGLVEGPGIAGRLEVRLRLFLRLVARSWQPPKLLMSPVPLGVCCVLPRLPLSALIYHNQ